MYMEAYGNVGSIADSVIKKATNKMEKDVFSKKNSNSSQPEEPKEQELNFDLKQTISEDGVSPTGGGVGLKATAETISRVKAMESLSSKLNNLKDRKEYLKQMVYVKNKEVNE